MTVARWQTLAQQLVDLAVIKKAAPAERSRPSIASPTDPSYFFTQR